MSAWTWMPRRGPAGRAGPGRCGTKSINGHSGRAQQPTADRAGWNHPSPCDLQLHGCLGYRPGPGGVARGRGTSVSAERRHPRGGGFGGAATGAARSSSRADGSAALPSQPFLRLVNGCRATLWAFICVRLSLSQTVDVSLDFLYRCTELHRRVEQLRAQQRSHPPQPAAQPRSRPTTRPAASCAPSPPSFRAQTAAPRRGPGPAAGPRSRPEREPRIASRLGPGASRHR